MIFELESLEIFKRLICNMSYWDAKVIVVPCAIIFDLLFAYIWSRLIVFFEFPSSKFIHFLWRTLTFKISAFVYLLQTSWLLGSSVCFWMGYICFFSHVSFALHTLMIPYSCVASNTCPFTKDTPNIMLLITYSLLYFQFHS